VRLHVSVTNGLPLGADATFYLAGTSGEVANPQAGTVSLAAACGAATLSTDGAAAQPAVNDMVLDLSGSQVDVFQNSPLFVGGFVHLPGTGAQKVKVRAQDAVSARVWLEAEGQVVR